MMGHPAEYRPRASAVGQHYDMNAESALTTYYTWCYDLEYLLYLSQVKKDGLNKMEIKLVRLLACTEVKMAVKAEALLWIKLFLPLRIALNAEDMDLRCLDMNEYYLRVADLLKLWSTEDITDTGFSPSVCVCLCVVCVVVCACICVVFVLCTHLIFAPLSAGPKPNLKIESAEFFPFWGLKECEKLHKHFESYREWKLSECAAVEAPDDDNHAGLWKACLKAMCVGAYKKFKEFAHDQLPKGAHNDKDGEYAKPSTATKERMSRTKPTNKIAESSFGIYDRLLKSIVNASSVTLTAMTAAKMTKPFDWIRANTTDEQRLHLFNWARMVTKDTMHTHTHIHTHTTQHVYLTLHAYANTHTHTDMYTYMYHSRTHRCTHTYTHTYIHHSRIRVLSVDGPASQDRGVEKVGSAEGRIPAR
jgi:hypothetical protein